jgi:hypothetical protein
LLTVVLDCTPDRNVERLVAPGRAEHRKLTNPEILATLRANERLLKPAGLPLIELDISNLDADEAAAALADRCRAWLESASQDAEPRP